MTATLGRPEPTTRRLGAFALLALLAGPLLSMVDSNVVNVAVPDIARELHGTLSSVQWAVSGYLLALAAALPATSWLAKRFGTVPVYTVSLAAFTAASAACAVAGSVPALVTFRVAQGVVAAPLVPLAMNLLFGGAGAARGGVPVSAGLVLFLGPALGPTVGGLLVSAWGWPWVFLVNVPIGLAALTAVPSLRRYGITSVRDRSARFDPFGLLLLSTGLVAALFGTSEGPRYGWLSDRSWPYWTAGLVLLAGYLLWASRREHPAVDLRLLRSPQPALAIWLCVLTSVALFAVLFLIPILVQNLQGHSALASGLVLLPQGIVMGLSTRLGMTLGERGHLRAGILTGLVAVAVTTALLLLVELDTPLWLTALILAGRGVGLGLVIQPLLMALLGGLSETRLADANTLFNVAQRLGGSVGVSLLATLFSVRVAEHVAAVLGPHASVGSATGSLAQAPPALRARLADAALSGFRETILVAVVVALVGLLFALLLRPRAAAGGDLAVPVD
ncbi:MAG TPA: DHA2 family efflux MFS transporter permease subunit [Micromonosporaceae bacterium]